MQFDSIQLEAINNATSNPFWIITGGAGTGKTTIISKITQELKARGEDVALVAFAGKAAARLREACRHPASTIHRLLEYRGVGFAAGDLTDRSIIMDESSMVSADLMSEVMSRKPRRLMLVGDQAQLPPVGKGQPFHDLLALRPEIVTNLTTCYRATEAVYKAANAIRNGERPAMQERSPNESWTCMNTGDANQTQVTILDWVKNGFLDFSEDIILCPRNGDNPEHAGTVSGLNAAISTHFRPGTNPNEYQPGDRVINTKNLPEKDVWNGTSGTVHSVDIDGGVWVTTDLPVIDYDQTQDEENPVYTDKVFFTKKERKYLQLAYALTVHKSQGSQYRRVIYVCMNRDAFALLDRSLTYTAVTRTKAACCVVGELSAFWQSIDAVKHRRTILQQLAA